MFTGLVETTAVVRHLRRTGEGARLGLTAKLGRLVLGESVSVNGACLTVARNDRTGFEADVSAETLTRTTLGALRPGQRVNVERATRLGDRMGGHIVAGHVDGVGRVALLAPAGSARRCVVRAPADVQHLLAAKGSVTMDGVSLTVNQLVSDGDPDTQGFEVMLVPHTLAHTTLVDIELGLPVNLEADVLARYVARQLELSARGESMERGPAESPRLERAPSRRQAARKTTGRETKRVPRAGHDAPARANDGDTTAGDRALLEQLRQGGFLE